MRTKATLNADLAHVGALLASIAERIHERALERGDVVGVWRETRDRLEHAFVSAGGEREDLDRLFGVRR